MALILADLAKILICVLLFLFWVGWTKGFVKFILNFFWDLRQCPPLSFHCASPHGDQEQIEQRAHLLIMNCLLRLKKSQTLFSSPRCSTSGASPPLSPAPLVPPSPSPLPSLIASSPSPSPSTAGPASAFDLLTWPSCWSSLFYKEHHTLFKYLKEDSNLDLHL